MISYFNDRILTPEMMRAMIILYIGPHHRPDFGSDYLLSPCLAPDSLLAAFPRTWMLTGERDPLVDDTVIFAGRLRQAKRGAWVEGREMGLEWARKSFDEEGVVRVELVTVSVPSLKMPPPTRKLAELSLRVELMTIDVPVLWMPPPNPLSVAVFPLMVELVTVSMPSLEMPPPDSPDWLPVIEVSLTRIIA